MFFDSQCIFFPSDVTLYKKLCSCRKETICDARPCRPDRQQKNARRPNFLLQTIYVHGKISCWRLGERSRLATSYVGLPQSARYWGVLSLTVTEDCTGFAEGRPASCSSEWSRCVKKPQVFSEEHSSHEVSRSLSVIDSIEGYSMFSCWVGSFIMPISGP